MHRCAVSSWSLDGSLQHGVPLLELPRAVAEHGIPALEICHFHLPATDETYLAALRAALGEAGVELSTLLIDTGDITAPEDERRAEDVALIGEWMRIAATLGARRVRIDAGLQPPSPDVIERSAGHLRIFSAEARPLGLQVITENWHATSQPADALLAILDGCEGRVGLCADTGNAEATADKYATLAQLLPRATTIHFKARYDSDGALDGDDLRRCIDLIREHNANADITLIYGDKRDEWRHLDTMREALQPLLAA